MSVNFQIRHQSQYEFDIPVYLEPHQLLFYPKNNHQQKVHAFNMKIDPTPAGISGLLDLQDNQACLAWFNGEHRDLNVTAESKVELFTDLSMDFLIYPFECMELGFKYDGLSEYHLRQYLLVSPPAHSVVDYAEQLRHNHGPGTISFLLESTRQIHEDFEIVNRETGHPHSAEETIKLGSGSCRDLVVLQMAVCRHLGLASRFVSGYLYHGVDGEVHELHAWTEVYVPGAGWLAFDPTIGFMTAGDHIKVASGAVPELTLPIRGTFRGSATSTLITNVLIEKQE